MVSRDQAGRILWRLREGTEITEIARIEGVSRLTIYRIKWNEHRYSGVDLVNPSARATCGHKLVDRSKPCHTCAIQSLTQRQNPTHNPTDPPRRRSA